MKSFKPTTKSNRAKTSIEFSKLLSGHRPLKSLKGGIKRGWGRNNQGRITMRHRGGGHKKLLRAVDFSFNKVNIPAKIASIEYDPFRSAFIGLAVYRDGEKRYVLVPKNIRVGDTFIVSETASV